MDTQKVEEKPIEYKELEEPGVTPKEDTALMDKFLSQVLPYIQKQTEMIFNQLKHLRVGGENTTIHMSDQLGMWAGHAEFALAPFRLGLDGSLTASNATSGNAVTVPTLQNSWVDYGSVYAGLSYYKTLDNIVVLQGTIKSGTGGLIFTLPVGYRPSAQRMFPIVSNNAFGRVDIGSDGNVVGIVYNNAYVSLDGIVFRV
jgi:hypothetical protein